MSDQVELAVIGMIQVVLVAFLAYLSNRNHRETRAEIEVVKNDVNGKMEKLLTVTGQSERAKGNLEGRSEAAQEAKEK